VKKFVMCEKHGRREKAFLCMHLGGGQKSPGFYQADFEEDLPPIAWCGFCEDLRVNVHLKPTLDFLFPLISDVCAECFSEARKGRKRRLVKPSALFER
jgi:hypothetical protein